MAIPSFPILKYMNPTHLPLITYYGNTVRYHNMKQVVHKKVIAKFIHRSDPSVL